MVCDQYFLSISDRFGKKKKVKKKETKVKTCGESENT